MLFRSGIGVIHKNMTIEEQARQVAIVKRAENGMIYDPVTIRRGTEGPEQRILRKDEAMTVYQILHYLDEPYKEVFTLKVLGELNYKEIAQIFGKQETWARVTYHRARVKIQDILERRST